MENPEESTDQLLEPSLARLLGTEPICKISLCLYIQAYLRDIAGSVLNHCNKANIAKKQVK